MMLTKLDRNKIYEAITEGGLNPAEFKLTVTPANTVISHISGSTFEFVKEAGGMRAAFSKAVRGEVGTVGDTYYSIKAIVIDGSQNIHDAAPDFSHLLIDIREWADEIKLVVETPDYWADTQLSRELINDIQREDTENTPFNEDEQKQIAAQLHEITKQLKEQFELTNEQIERIEEWRHEATETSTRMGRKDWLIYFLGTITALIITATVTAGVGEHIFAMVIHGLGHLFTGGDGPPRILA